MSQVNPSLIPKQPIPTTAFGRGGLTYERSFVTRKTYAPSPPKTVTGGYREPPQTDTFFVEPSSDVLEGFGLQTRTLRPLPVSFSGLSMAEMEVGLARRMLPSLPVKYYGYSELDVEIGRKARTLPFLPFKYETVSSSELVALVAYAKAHEQELLDMLELQEISTGGHKGLSEIVRLATAYPVESAVAFQSSFALSVYGMQLQRSQRFYQTLGYPEFAGKYEPISIPTGQKVTSISETSSGLKVMFEPLHVQEPSIVETLYNLSYESKRLASIENFFVEVGQKLQKDTITERPLESIAGFVAPIESFTYSMADLAMFATGIKLVHRQYPSTALSAMIGGQDVSKYSRTYIGSTILGDIMLSLGLGYLFKPITAPITSRISKFISEPILKKYATDPLSLSRIERWILGKTQPYFAYGEVSVPLVEKALPSGKVARVFTEEALEAFDIGWEVSSATRMGGVLFSKQITEQTLSKRLLPTLVSFSGYSWMEYGERKLLPFTTQQQLTRMGIYPYIPRLSIATSSSAYAQYLLGFGIPIGLRTIERQEPRIGDATPLFVDYLNEPFALAKFSLETGKVERQTRKLFYAPFRLTEPKFKTKTVIGDKLEEKQEAFILPSIKPKLAATTMQVAKTTQKQKQIQKQIQQMTTPQKLELTAPKPYDLPDTTTIRKTFKQKQRTKKQGVGRYKREYPIMTPEDVLKYGI